MIRRKRVARSTDVRVTFTLPANAPPGPVSVVGSFNAWTPGLHPLRKRAGGVRSAAVVVPAGSRVHFRYLASGGHWFDDADADAITDAGGFVHV
jgi:hypothetical protein